MTERTTTDSKFLTVFCAVIAEMDLAVLNLINVFFISKGLGDDAVSAYELVMPCLFLVCGIIALGYNGIQAVCSKDYGSGNKEMFDRHKNAGYTWMIVILALIAVLFLIFKEPVLDLLGANEEGPNIARLSEECYLVFIPCFVLQGFFAVVSSLLFLEEKKVLIYLNIIFYAVFFSGNLLVLNLAPSMTGFIAVNAVSEAFAVVFVIVYWILKRERAISAYTVFRVSPKDIKDSVLTGLPDFMEYAFAAVLSLILNLYMIARFASNVLAGFGVFEALENIPELICLAFCFLSTATFGVRVGRVLQAYKPEERLAAETELEKHSRNLTRAGVVASIVLSALMILFARPVVIRFFTEASDPETVNAAVLLVISYSVGFTFYMLNSEIVCYYKVVKAFWSAHIIFLVEALAFPLLMRIVLGELFGITGFCIGGAAAEILTFILNLCFIWKACGHFPLSFKDFRMDKHIGRMRKNEADLT